MAFGGLKEIAKNQKTKKERLIEPEAAGFDLAEGLNFIIINWRRRKGRYAGYVWRGNEASCIAACVCEV